VTYLLDTSIISESRKPRPDAGVIDWLSITPMQHMHLSVLTVGEIGRGIAKLAGRGDHPQAGRLETWLDEVVTGFGARIVPVTAQVARLWGRQGGALPVIDGLIGATAVVYGWTLVTRNVKDFEPQGVPVLNPFNGKHYSVAR
jgi:predicted nucleic acid-binding protein